MIKLYGIWVVIGTLCLAMQSNAASPAPTGEVWQPTRQATEQFLSAVEAFVDGPNEGTWAESMGQWENLMAEWLKLAPDYADDPHQRNWTRWFASKRVEKNDIESLIGASTCPVPFSVAMVRLLSADMQGLHTFGYLLQTHPRNDEPTGHDMAQLFESEPRRAAYLRSITLMFQEKVDELYNE